MSFSQCRIFFISGQLTLNINSNLIVLILKVPGARVMGDYRPISLANFQFKIVTEIIVDRLVGITMRIIYVEQRGFIRDHNIFECVILTSEAINLLKKRQYGGNVALKFDIAKAFDTLDWNFLIAVLQRFDFGDFPIRSFICVGKWESCWVFFLLARSSPRIFVVTASFLSGRGGS